MDWVARQRAFCVLRRATSLTGGTAAGAGMPVIVFAACSTIRRAISATLVLEAPQPPVDARLGVCEQYGRTVVRELRRPSTSQARRASHRKGANPFQWKNDEGSDLPPADSPTPKAVSSYFIYLPAAGAELASAFAKQ